MKVLVTGGAGFIGSHLCAKLAASAFVEQVVVLDDLSTGNPANIDVDGVSLVVGSILDSDRLEQSLQGVDAIVHLAAIASVGRAAAQPELCNEVNATGTDRVLQAARRAGVRHVILASTSAVYGNDGPPVKHEALPTAPLSAYAVSKLAAEGIATRYREAGQLDTLILRFFNVFGPRQPVDGMYSAVIPRFVQAARDHTEIPVHGDGTQIRDFVQVGTVTDVIVDALARRVSAQTPVNVASGTPHSLWDVIDTLSSFAGAPLQVRHEPARLDDIHESRADTTRMQELFPAVQPASLQAGLQEMWTADIAAGVTDAESDAGLDAALRHLPTSGRVVIVSASVGGGHDGAANELARRMTDQGLAVTQLDFLKLAPWACLMMTYAYVLMLKFAPWMYQVVYSVLGHSRVLCFGTNVLMSGSRRRTLRAIPDDTVLVVSTYPLSSQTLGWLRRHRKLTVPAATFLTDSSVHRLWVGKGVDYHYALTEETARQARKLGASKVILGGALVRRGFVPLSEQERRAARQSFGLPTTGRLALLVGGAWGVGDFVRAARDVAATGIVEPVVVCGQNGALQKELIAAGIPHVLGWVDRMPDLVGAVDVVVQNAGGLTSLEAFACGVPVLSFRNIPGHGRTNAIALNKAGLALSVRRPANLAGAISELLDGPRGLRQRAAGMELTSHDPAEAMLASVGLHQDRFRRRGLGTARRLSVVAVSLGVTFLVGTEGAEFAAAHGVEAIRVKDGQGTFLVIHPTGALDAATITQLSVDNAAVAVDHQYAEQYPDIMRQLADAGVMLINAGRGAPYRTGLVSGRTAMKLVASKIGHAQGSPPKVFLSGSDVDAVDMVTVASLREKLMVPNYWSSTGSLDKIKPGDIALLECSNAVSCNNVVRTAADGAQAHGLQLRAVRDLLR